MLYAPANGGRAGECGPAMRIADAGIRASLPEAERRQSKTADKACALHANNPVR